MIVCSCNVLTDTQILAALRADEEFRPRSPAQVYRCLGCAPRCGRCMTTVRAMLAEAHLDACAVGCAVCPAGEHHAHEPEEAREVPFLMAAE